jgi:hypothetical protein
MIPPMRRLPLVTLSIILVWTVGGLWLDSQLGSSGQLALGIFTACLLGALLAFHAPTVRLQALGVVLFATIGEVIGSLIWGLYAYRLDNLPAFVPPGHGLIYLAGFSLATLCTERPRPLLGAAALGAAVWGLAGVTVLPTPDASGAIGCAFLLVVLGVTRRPVYAGVFIIVAFLELYGTALGTWRWEAVVPGLGLSQGNPPSGVASGYVVFDVLALALAARLSGLGATLGTLRGRAQSISARIAARSTG